MSLKAIVALLLTSLCVPAHAQAAGDASAQSLESAATSKPSTVPILQAFVSSGLSGVSTRVFVVYDESGRILVAKVEPSTQDPGLDKAIQDWAKRVRLKPGKPGTGWLPIEITNPP